MKSKIASFISALMTLLAIGILCILGIIIYDQFTKTNLTGEVQDFVSNITVSSGGIDQNIKAPEIIESVSDSLQENDENIDYSNNEIDKFFYDQLNDYSKVIYRAMDSNKENMKTGTYEINMGSQFSDLLLKDNGDKLLGEYYQSAIEAYTYDNPDVFYIDFAKLYLNIETTAKGSKKTYRVFINAGNSANYLTEQFPSKEKIESAINEIEKVKAYFVKNKKSNTYDNIKLVHDYLVESIEYDQSTSQPNIYDLYGAIVNKKCVCEGYAKAFKYLMDSLNIPCMIVTGEGTNSEGNTENHAWNYIQLNENWYAVDCTWDDPILEGGFLTNSLKYKYFLKGSKEFDKTHIVKGQFTENGKVFSFPQLSIEDY